MHNILSKVFGSSAAIIISTIAFACFLCKWPLFMTIIAVMASIVISAPPTICLHLLILLALKFRIERAFVWLLLLASVPVSSLVVAWIFVDLVPGKVWFLLLLGMLSGYAGLLTNGISVSKILNSSGHESE